MARGEVAAGAAATQNLAHLVLRHAVAQPGAQALVIPTRWDQERVLSQQQVTYGQLWERVEAYRRGLRAAGYQAGDRVVLMMPVSVELYAFVLALLAQGMVAVLVDTGMGVGRTLDAIRASRAVALVSVGRVLGLRAFLPALYAMRCYSVDEPRGVGVRPLSSLSQPGGLLAQAAGEGAAPLRAVRAEDHALITFTSGSTGRPKGADRTHGLLRAQHKALSAHFPERVTDVECPSFPVAVLHHLCCGQPSILPAVDLRAPATVNPKVLAAQLEQHQVTRLAAAPALMERLARWMIERDHRSPQVRTVLVGGGPVSQALCELVVRAFPQADSVVVYGSTEAEPMTSVSMRERLAPEQAPGEGTLVGRAAPMATLGVVELPPGLHRLDERGLAPYEVAPGQVGEVVVRGPHVVRAYVEDAQATRDSKLIEPDQAVWHRTGDTGRWDEQGRLWLVGRLKDVVRHGEQVLHPFDLEERVERLEGVQRAALIERPKRASQPWPQAALLWSADHSGAAASGQGDPSVAIEALLRERGIDGALIERVAWMPVDRRHNTKLDRQALRLWLALTRP